jgi:hypothetical protein
MANKVTNFGTVKNLREWFNEQFANENTYLFCKEDKCYNADLIWDGTNYHIAYEDSNGIRYVQPFTYTDERVWSVRTENQTEN